jgi:hypothetical protein
MMKEAFDTPTFSSGKHIRFGFGIYLEVALKEGVYGFGSFVHSTRKVWEEFGLRIKGTWLPQRASIEGVTFDYRWDLNRRDFATSHSDLQNPKLPDLQSLQVMHDA